MNTDKKCTCDAFCDYACPVHYHENALQNKVLHLQKEIEQHRAGVADIARRLNLFLPDDFDPYYTIGLDIDRLQRTEKAWSDACALARNYCPVDVGESHIRDGIPRLAQRAESAELGCDIAYEREPTQAEGDAHEYPKHKQLHAQSECFVSMGSHHGWKCKCGVWVWGGPTVCQRCVDKDAVKIAVEFKADADTKEKVARAWEQLYNERNRLWRDAEDRLDVVRSLLEQNGCDCDCDQHPDERGPDCEVCLACRIGGSVAERADFDARKVHNAAAKTT